MTEHNSASAAYSRTEHFPPMMGRVLRYGMENCAAEDLDTLAAELLAFTTVSEFPLHSSVPPLPTVAELARSLHPAPSPADEPTPEPWCEEHGTPARTCTYCITDPVQRGEIDESTPERDAISPGLTKDNPALKPRCFRCGGEARYMDCTTQRIDGKLRTVHLACARLRPAPSEESR